MQHQYFTRSNLVLSAFGLDKQDLLICEVTRCCCTNHILEPEKVSGFHMLIFTLGFIS
ncbi:hypothetical protein EXN66_Car000429 [Channa argus]|uniref:Uncharacterized protein n=1 Tax=Channa argus TaxID=215402 RepID=A0A6G1QYV2_CHAAH|nr:hypothetical protein EXN66_Car000429 [Channa argus]